jgi:hypothetical protein
VAIPLETGCLLDGGAEVRVEEVYFGKAKDVVGDLRSRYCHPLRFMGLVLTMSKAYNL